MNIKSDRFFWLVNLFLGFASLCTVLLFFQGLLPFVDFGKCASNVELEFLGGFDELMKVLPLAAWFFIGVEALNLSMDHIEDPKKTIPVAQASCMLTLVATGLAIFFVSVSLATGVDTIPTEDIPFNRGFEKLFDASRYVTRVFSLPATFSTSFGFMWYYGKVIFAMAKSRLLLPVFAKTTSNMQALYAALLLGSACSYVF